MIINNSKNIYNLLKHQK